jgi:predicted nucleotidyltransferase
MYKQKLTSLQEDIIRLLFIRAGESLNQRRIANLLKVSPPAVMKAIKKLDQYMVAVQDKESKRWSIELNRNQEIMRLKRVDNLKQIYQSGLAHFLEDKFPGSTIALFGSYSRGEDTINSDVDIAIIGKEKNVDLSKYEKCLQRKIIINFYPSFKDIHKHLKENIYNGIVLTGGVEL